MEDCIFCKIINKEIPAEIIYENEFAVVIKDIHPQASVHVLVIPKKHIKDINYIDEMFSADLLGIHLAVKEAAKVAAGGGGGRPDMAQAGGKDINKIEEALTVGSELAKKQIINEREKLDEKI